MTEIVSIDIKQYALSPILVAFYSNNIEELSHEIWKRIHAHIIDVLETQKGTLCHIIVRIDSVKKVLRLY